MENSEFTSERMNKNGGNKGTEQGVFLFLLFRQEPYIYGIKRHSLEQGNNIFYIVQNYEYLYKYTVFPVREYAHIYARKEILVLLCHLFVKEGVIKND